ncbi:MAG: flavodoxin-dependent (E)-4-hydroxy-3-methylbut-2-enyl-diphosphate synthase [Candidatus Tectomicrobia bacterium]|nr:flavodoxin-dependent (E)-4-hydroxy-3-methylbut-2-enyl-diphosphate synthase [Candidatus Tectomicrobia bacterium]
MIEKERKSRPVFVGGVQVGGGAPVSVQSMTDTDTRDTLATMRQINQLEEVGCEIVRVAVPDMDAARCVRTIKAGTHLPLVADIHFDYRLALEALKGGIDCLRINPGNIRAYGGGEHKVREIARACADLGIPIRIGVNSGSLEVELVDKHGGPMPEAMVESALRHVELLEKFNFDRIKISLKASDVWRTVKAYRLIADRVDYPLHLGVTEAGAHVTGAVKTTAAFSLLLSEGIGDTIRVSLAASPLEEVKVGYEILKALELRHHGINVVACPTCGRIQIDVEDLANRLEKGLAHIKYPVTVAVMGCEVNGPGEAKDADIGIAGGKGEGMIFKKGQKFRKVREEDFYDVIVEEVERMAAEGTLAAQQASGQTEEEPWEPPLPGGIKVKLPVIP